MYLNISLLCNNEHRDVYGSTSIVRIRNPGVAGHAARKQETRNAYVTAICREFYYYYYVMRKPY
jgi:hypothetical protein